VDLGTHKIHLFEDAAKTSRNEASVITVCIFVIRANRASARGLRRLARPTLPLQQLMQRAGRALDLRDAPVRHLGDDDLHRRGERHRMLEAEAHEEAQGLGLMIDGEIGRRQIGNETAQRRALGLVVHVRSLRSRRNLG